MELATVVLRHELRGGVHYDWLVELPGDPNGLLWTGRVAIPSSQWLAAGSWDVRVIEPHRRLYLSYEGVVAPDPVTLEDRGIVSRVDEGWVRVKMWTGECIVFGLRMKHCGGVVCMERGRAETWWAEIKAAVD